MSSAPTYKRLDPREHVLFRPGMYIGSVRPDSVETWVLRADEPLAIERAEVVVAPGLVTIFDEVLNNAVDHAWRCASLETPVRNIKVEIDAASGRISVWNDGPGIQVEEHEDSGILVPELVFGHLLTSSNYDDDEERTVGGQNGIGAKSTNIFSSRFDVETVSEGRMFQQTWRANMTERGEPRTRKCSRKAPYTRVSFEPDWARFGMPDGLTGGAEAVLRKRVADASAVTPANVAVSLNGARFACKTFERYADLYLGPRAETPRFHEACGGDWEVVVAEARGPAHHVSFVNGICTRKGGKHVDHVLSVLSKRVSEALGKRGNVRPAHVRNAVRVFVRCTVANPTFDSQTKDELTTPVSLFRSKFAPSDAFVERLCRGAIGERVMSLSRSADEQTLRKTDGRMRSTITGVPKLDDANWAGTARAARCTLILTEGDSAKAMAVSGLAVVGRDAYGVYPLRGKMLNARDAGRAKIAANEEISALKKILGLESGKDYSTPESRATLRYGSVMVLTDQDVDGFHIKGLVMNVFHSLWPSLFRSAGFISSMLTPVVRAWAPRRDPVSFYTVPQFEEWAASEEYTSSSWRVKYYKGLGTSTADEAKQYFRDMRRVTYAYACDAERARGPGGADQEGPVVAVDLTVAGGRVAVALTVRFAAADDSDDAIDMAFSKSRAHDRKDWLRAPAPRALDYGDSRVTFADFVNRELRLFSLDDTARSIPSAVDGLKPSQRKILYACKRRPAGEGELRVAQLAGFVSRVAAYHHGEASLQSTIVGLAQDFVGAGNCPLLDANGQFGTRLQGGKDCASARYINTDLRGVARAMFPSEDEPVLQRALDDDRNPVEPTHYLPVLPLVLLNGASGIGTGFSTNVPCFDARALAEIYLARLAAGAGAGAGSREFGASVRALAPCYNGFRGRVEWRGGKWVSTGAFRRASRTALEITELPVGTWTDDYKTWLEQKATEVAGVRRVESHYTESDVRFVLHFDEKRLDELVAEDASTLRPRAETELRLVSDKGLSVSNMYLFDASGRIAHYPDVAEVAEAHFRARLDGYAARREHAAARLEGELRVLEAKEQFVTAVISGAVVLADAEDDVVERAAAARGWAAVDGSHAYLARMPLSSLTRSRADALRRERGHKQAEMAGLLASTPESLWKQDIERVLALLP